MADNSMAIKLGLFGAALYVAYSQGWLSFLGIGTATSSTPSASTASTPVTAVTTTPATPAVIASAPTGNTLDSLYSAMLSKAQAAGAATGNLGVDAWGYYLNQSGITAPDPMPIFSAAVPNFDRSQGFTISQYWAIMAPALQSQLGLSGLGVYGGLGQLMRRYA